MTPTTSSSPIVLLTAGASTGKADASTTGQAAPGLALSGFELLFGALRQMHESLDASVGEGDIEIAPANAEAEEGGNALPLTGILLPSAAVLAGEGAVSGDEVENGDTKKPAADADEKVVAQVDPALSPAPIFAPTPVVNKTGDDALSPLANAEATGAIESVGNFNAGGDASKSARASALTTNQLQPRETGVSDVAANAAADIDIAPTLPRNAAAATPTPESDFDILLKQFDNPNATTPAPTVANVVSPQASRAYANAANGNAAVQVPVASPGWSDAVADKVMWFSAQKISSAEIHLNPPELGPLQVRVTTQHDQASVVFTSQHAAVRDALDQALPRLRDMMGSQGMQLDVFVGGQTAQQQHQQQLARENTPNNSAFTGFLADDAAQSAAVQNVTAIDTARLLRSGVDAYA